MHHEGDKCKVLIIGPQRSGKTNIANALSDTRDTPTYDYKETSPLRILVAEIDGMKLPGHRLGRGAKVTVELWDLGGNPKYQSCWTAVHKGADGIIYVINPEIKGQEKELSLWHKAFAIPSEVPDKHCLVFSHHSSTPERSVGGNAIPTLPKCVEHVRAIETSLDFQSDNFKEAFEKMIEYIMIAKQEAEENAALAKDDAMDMSGPVRFSTGY
eukprot:Tbor_TRINITY_DN5333_c0_g4::TRINITY_DN5333_c0_g4_i1::g.4753::m.4753/K07935/IFT22, RABL5; intraflagellar transport protein 22